MESLWTITVNSQPFEFASLHIEGDNSTSDPEYSKWLGMLISPGSSLGGARPKALWIAKFPSGNDTKDVGAWEDVVATLAQNYGIEVAPFKAQKFSNKQHAFCSNTDYNLELLWRRIAFSVEVSNYDDHLRNHGFLLTPRGWTLSPAMT